MVEKCTTATVKGKEDGETDNGGDGGDGGTARFTVTSVQLGIGTAPSPGETAVAHATVTNEGDAKGTKTIPIKSGLKTIGSFEATLQPGESKTVEIDIPVPEKETVSLSVGGEPFTFDTTYTPGGDGSNGGEPPEDGGEPPRDGDGEPRPPFGLSGVVDFAKENKLAVGAMGLGAAYLISKDGSPKVIRRVKK